MRIPLCETRSEPRAFALIDDADAALVEQHNWSMKEGYAYRNAGGRTVYLHRLILGLRPGDGLVVDHVNRDRLDNRRENLRVGTHALNQQNRPGFPGTSRFRGVYLHRSGVWMARVKINYRHHYLGSFDNELDAALAAQAYRDVHMPFAMPDPELAAA